MVNVELFLIFIIQTRNHLLFYALSNHILFFLHCVEIKKMQQLARDHSRKIIEENNSLALELEHKRKELDERSRQINKMANQNSIDKKKLEEEKNRV